MSSYSSSLKSLGNVCVIGGCGFLGGNIVRLLHSRHPQTNISVVDLRTTNNRVESPLISYHDGDITSYDAMKAIFTKAKPDVIIHTASPLATGAVKEELMYKVNVEGTKNLVAVSQEVGCVKAFVYTSSASVICTKTMDIANADERWPVVVGEEAMEYYSSTKAEAELYVLSVNRTPAHFLTCAIRPSGIFGEGDRQNIPGFVTAYRNGRDNVQIGDNDNLFDFTHVENIAHAHLLAAYALLATSKLGGTVPLDSERVDGEAFFITNDSPIYWWDFARAVWSEVGPVKPISKVWVLSKGFMLAFASIRGALTWIGLPQGPLTKMVVRIATLQRYYNIDKAKQRLGYEPVVALQDGIRRGVKAVMEERGWTQEKKAQ